MHNNKTDWNAFGEKLDKLILLDQPLKAKLDIELAVKLLTKNIQEAAWSTTSIHQIKKRQLGKKCKKRHQRKKL